MRQTNGERFSRKWKILLEMRFLLGLPEKQIADWVPFWNCLKLLENSEG